MQSNRWTYNYQQKPNMETPQVKGCLEGAHLSTEPRNCAQRTSGWSLKQTINTLFGRCASFADVASTVMYTWNGKDQEEKIPEAESLNRTVRGKVLKCSPRSRRKYGQTLEVPTSSVFDDDVSALSSYTLEEMERRERMMTKLRGLEHSGKDHNVERVQHSSNTYIPKLNTGWMGSLKRATSSMDNTASFSDSSEEDFADDPAWAVQFYEA